MNYACLVSTSPTTRRPIRVEVSAQDAAKAAFTAVADLASTWGRSQWWVHGRIEAGRWIVTDGFTVYKVAIL